MEEQILDMAKVEDDYERVCGGVMGERGPGLSGGMDEAVQEHTNGGVPYLTWAFLFG